MSCTYSDFNGKCELWNKNIVSSGTDKKGCCVVENDEDPSATCEDYESLDSYDDDWE